MRLRDTPFQPGHPNTTTANLTNPMTQHFLIQTPALGSLHPPQSLGLRPPIHIGHTQHHPPGHPTNLRHPICPILRLTHLPSDIPPNRRVIENPIPPPGSQPLFPSSQASTEPTPTQGNKLTSPPRIPPVLHTTTATETQPTPPAPAARKCTGTAPALRGRRSPGTRSRCRRRRRRGCAGGGRSRWRGGWRCKRCRGSGWCLLFRGGRLWFRGGRLLGRGGLGWGLLWWGGGRRGGGWRGLGWGGGQRGWGGGGGDAFWGWETFKVVARMKRGCRDGGLRFLPV